jgi:hypothetical protein
MIGHARSAVKFFVYGLVLGLLFAPRSGEETRKEVLGWITGTIQETVGNVTGGGGSSARSGGFTPGSAE